MEWYVRIGERRLGPISIEALRAMAETGQLGPEARLWRPGMADWVPALSVPGILIPPESPPSVNTTSAASDSTRIPEETTAGVAIRAMPRGNDSSPGNTTDIGSRASTSTALEASPSLSLRTEDKKTSTVGGSAAAEVAWPAPLATPWPRFWARMVDCFLWTSLLTFLVGMVRPSILSPDGFFGDDRRLAWFLLPFAVIVDATVYAAFGNTFGKWLAGIRVLDLTGKPASFRVYLRRNFGVWWSGLGTGFPLISLLTLASSHKRATKGELMSWDESNATRALAVSTSTARTWAVALIYFVILAGSYALMAVEAHEGVVGASKRAEPSLQTKPPDIEQQLREAASVVNQGTPTMVDEGTRLDRAEAGPGLNFTYHYTLTGLRKSDLETAKISGFFHGEFVDNLRRKVCTGSEFSEMLREHVTINFHYVDQAGADLATLTTNNTDCGRSGSR